DSVREALRDVEFDAPEGHVKVDGKTQHVYKYFRLGKIRDDRQFDIVYETPQWIAPNPYPDFAFPGWSCDWTSGGVKKGMKVEIGKWVPAVGRMWVRSGGARGRCRTAASLPPLPGALEK